MEYICFLINILFSCYRQNISDLRKILSCLYWNPKDEVASIISNYSRHYRNLEKNAKRKLEKCKKSIFISRFFVPW